MISQKLKIDIFILSFMSNLKVNFNFLSIYICILTFFQIINYYTLKNNLYFQNIFLYIN